MLHVWDVAQAREIRRFDSPGTSARCVVFSGDAKYVFAGGFDYRIRMWDVAAGKEVRQYHGHTAAIYAVRMIGSRRQAVSATRACACGNCQPRATRTK